MSLTATELAPAEYPSAPVTKPIKGTLLDIVTPVNGTSRNRIPGGIGLFPSYGCIETGTRLGGLCGPTEDEKYAAAQSPVWQDGLGFGAYGMVVCKLVDPAELQAGVERAYTFAESRIVEAAIMEGLFTEQTASGAQGGWDAPVDITPTIGTAVDPSLGLGLLESHMAANYAGQGIVHMPRVIATLLSHRSLLELNGTQLETTLGTPVAAGGGYDLPNTGPDGDEAPDGEKWIYGTGWVSIVRQKLEIQDFFQIFGGTDDIDPNTFGSLTESLYLVSIDCYKAAVLVTEEP